MYPAGLIKTILTAYPLPVSGVHGPGHWARVLENGAHLAELTGADGLDLGRVWIIPDPGKLCTESARDPALIDWATKRAKEEFRPAILEEWLEGY